MSETRMLIISPGVPHRTKGASSVLFYHYINQLREAGFRILNVLLCDPLHEPVDFDGYLRTYKHELQKPGQFDIVAMRSPGFIRRSPVSIRLDKKSLEPVKGTIESFAPEIALCFDLMSAWAAVELNCQGVHVAWLGDLNFETDWYHAMYGFRENPLMGVKVPVIWLRGHLWRRIYQEVLADFEAVIVSSKSSVDHLSRLGISSKYLPYPWPNESAGEGDGNSPQAQLPTFVFFGNLKALGSRSALHYFIHKLHPRLIDHWGHGGFRIKIAGAGKLPGWARKALDARHEFEIIGFESDLDGLLSGCHAMVAPIDVPVGNRSRIVTAMAKHCLVITHKNAALGNPDLVDGETCYLAGTPDEFLDRMDAAVTERQLATEIAGRAREVYDKRFRPVAAFQMLMDVLDRVGKVQRA